MSDDLHPIPLTRDEANAFITAHHRHHGRVTGHRFIVGAELGGALVGVAVAGRPVARLIDQRRALEVNRLATDSTRNVCSLLYSTCSRVARDLGFACCFTYILGSESGASLKASGWTYRYTTRGGTSDRPSRRRSDKAPIAPKQCWAPTWSPAPIALGRSYSAVRCYLEAAFAPDTASAPGATPSAGHCAAVAVIMHRLYGGEFVSATVQSQSHWFNRINGRDVDLTGDQFDAAPIRDAPAGQLWPGTRVRAATELRDETIARAELLASRAGVLCP